jgi:transposase
MPIRHEQLDRFDHMDDHTLDPKSEDIRRIEVITGVGRRRRWTAETKARIVAESCAGDVSVSEVARRHGIRPQQLFGWRHHARVDGLRVNPPAFVPIATEASCGSMRVAAAGTAIEIEVAGMVVRVRGPVAAAVLAEVLRAVRRAQ